MSKQERINHIYRYQQQRMFWRSVLTILVGMFVFFSLETHGNWMFFVPLVIGLGGMLHIIGKESRFVEDLTPYIQAKRLISQQYAAERGLLVLLAFIFPVIVLLQLPAWVLFVVFLSGVIFLHLRQRVLDDHIRFADPNQPMRREIKLDFVKE